MILEPHPTADAGPNFSIATESQAVTVIQGSAADADGDVLYYRWFEGAQDLSGCETEPCLLVGPNGEAPLDLGIIPLLPCGQHTLTLQVTDGVLVDTDEVDVTIDNSAPNVAATGGGTYQLGAEVFLGGEVTDFDGDTLTYEWIEDGNVLFSGQVQTFAGGDPVQLPTQSLYDINLGEHTIILQIDDGVNPPVSAS